MEEHNVVGLAGEQIDSLSLELKKVDEVAGCAIVSMKGYIDTYNSPHFQRQVDKAIQAGYSWLIFDFSAITYISSAGVGAFISFLKNVRPRGGDLVLVGMVPRVFEVFQLLGFANFFHTEQSLEDAVELMKAQSHAEAEKLFPKIFSCPICAKRLKTVRAGRFRCGECKTFLVVGDTGRVSLG